jgi:hypothetical protein
LFGYLLSEKTRWWEGLEPGPGEDWRREDGMRTFVLSEIEVRRTWQARGVGGEKRATLTVGLPPLGMAEGGACACARAKITIWPMICSCFR